GQRGAKAYLLPNMDGRRRHSDVLPERRLLAELHLARCDYPPPRWATPDCRSVRPAPLAHLQRHPVTYASLESTLRAPLRGRTSTPPMVVATPAQPARLVPIAHVYAQDYDRQ